MIWPSEINDWKLIALIHNFLPIHLTKWRWLSKQIFQAHKGKKKFLLVLLYQLEWEFKKNYCLLKKNIQNQLSWFFTFIVLFKWILREINTFCLFWYIGNFLNNMHWLISETPCRIVRSKYWSSIIWHQFENKWEYRIGP